MQNIFSWPDKTDFVSLEWLANNLNRVVVLGAPWQMGGRTPEAAAKKVTAQDFFATGHIRGAKCFDHDAIGNKNQPHLQGSGVKLAMPEAEDFANYVGSLGIDNKTPVVIYDNVGGLYGAPRAWWLFKIFGHEGVKIMSGRYEDWKRAGHPVDKGLLIHSFPSPRKVFKAQQAAAVLDYGQVCMERSGSGSYVDLQLDFEYINQTIPGSRNVPWDTLIDVEMKEGENWSWNFGRWTLPGRDVLRSRLESAVPGIETKEAPAFCEFGFMCHVWPLVTRYAFEDYTRLDPVYPGGILEYQYHQTVKNAYEGAKRERPGLQLVS